MDKRVRRSIGRFALAAGVGVATLLASSEAPAGAAVTGPCDATGTIGTTAYALRRIHRREVVTVPKAASIRWEGSVVGRSGRRVSYSGGVELTVAGFDFSVDRWRGTTAKVATDGTRPYDTWPLPGGVVYRLHATDSHGRITCTGEALVQLEGGKGAAVPIAIAGTAVTFLLALWFAVRGRWARGGLAGLVLGAFVAADLVLFARAELASRALLVFPVAGLVLGAVVAMTRRSRPSRRAA